MEICLWRASHTQQVDHGFSPHMGDDHQFDGQLLLPEKGD